MWLNNRVVEWFHISRDVLAAMREEVAALRAERDSLKLQLNATNNQMTWICAQINLLQAERAEFIAKIYGIKAPAVPEIQHTTPLNKILPRMGELGFQHIDEDTAKSLGIDHLIS